MARPKKLSNYTSDQLLKLWETTLEKEQNLKRTLLAQAKETVKELEAYFSKFGKNAHKLKAGSSRKVNKAKQGKRGALKAAVLAYLKPGPQPIKSIVIATKGKYASVFQTVNNLVKEKRIAKPTKRGGAYTLIK